MAALIDKLQKLIAHERSARSVGSTQEAEAFAQRIAVILTEHKLSMTEVEFEAQDANNPIGDSRIEGLPSRIAQWQHLLALGVATSLYCQVLTMTENGKTSSIIWVGRESDRGAAIAMFEYLAALGAQFAKARVDEIEHKPEIFQMRRLAAHDKKMKAQVNRSIRKILRDWTRDFLFGYAAALHMRLTENRKRLEAPAAGTGLIVRDQLAIETYVADHFSREKLPVRPAKTTFQGALSEGWHTGQSVSIKARAGRGAGD